MHVIAGKRVYHLIGDLNSESIKSLSAWYRENAVQSSEEWLSLMITSGGGWVDGTFGLIDYFLGIQRAKLQTVVLGQANSMAISLFLAGEQRVCTPRSTFFFHEMGRTFNKDTRWSISETRSQLEALEKMQIYYAELVATRTSGRFEVSEVIQAMKESRTLDASGIRR